MTASGSTDVDIARCDREAVVSMIDEFTAAYREVFYRPPHNEDARRVAEFTNRLRQDAQRPGFAAWTAGARRSDRLLGFATAWPTAEPFPTGVPAAPMPPSPTSSARGGSATGSSVH